MPPTMKPHIKLRVDGHHEVIRPGAVAHAGADRSSQQLASWLPFQGSPDSDLLEELPTLVSRSRDLIRNNGVAQGAMQTITDNVVGVGLRLSAMPDYRALGWPRDQAEAWSNQVEALWRGWADSTDCDAGDSLNFAGLTTQIFRGSLYNGEGLALPLWLPRPASWATRVQVIEADRLSNPNGQMDSALLRNGIEVDRYGAPVAYWIRTSHPGDVMLGIGPVAGEWQRIPARTAWGRRRIIHLHDKERAGVSRGKPILSAVLQQFKMLDKYKSAELDAAVVNALIAAFIETESTMEDLIALMGGNADSTRDYLTQRAGNRAKFKSGSIVPLYPGEKLASFAPGRPAAGFEPFVSAVLKYIGTGLNLPYELLMKDFSKTNYSSARAALNEAWRYFKSRREWLASGWARPVYELWLEEAINAGLVEAPDFYRFRAAYCRCRWIGTGRGWVDVQKEAAAAELRMRIGVSTLESECAEQGLDWEEVLEQRAVEMAFAQRLGVPLNTSATPATPAATDSHVDDVDREAEPNDPGEPQSQTALPTTPAASGFLIGAAA